MNTQEYKLAGVVTRRTLAIELCHSLHLRDIKLGLSDAYIEESRTPVFYIWVKPLPGKSIRKAKLYISGYEACWIEQKLGSD